MKALAIIVQTKRGENAFVVTSNNFTQQMAQEYSHTIYNIIIQSFKKSQRVDRTFLFKRDISVVCNIGKDMILQVIVPNSETQYGVECLKKANELLVKHTKNETTLKKYIEIFSCLEELIYSRDFSPLKLHLSLKPSEIQSPKKSIDLDIFAKFPLLNNDGEKGLIQNVPLKYSKRAFTQHRETNLRYQVVKTCEIPISKIQGETEMKKFYRQNLASHAFNKSLTRASIVKRQSTAPKIALNNNPPSYNMAVTMTNLDASTIDPHPISPSSSQMRGNASQIYGSSSPFAYGNGGSPPYGNNGQILSPPKSQYDPMEIFNRPSSQSQNLSPDSKAKIKIFEEKKEVAVESSFNSFSHDMFNTVSLPAQLNIPENNTYAQASPRMSQSSTPTSKNAYSTNNNNASDYLSDYITPPQKNTVSTSSSNRSSMNNGNAQSYTNNPKESYASHDLLDLDPIPTNSSSINQPMNSWDLLNQIPLTTSQANQSYTSANNGQQNRDSMSSGFQDSSFSTSRMSFNTFNEVQNTGNDDTTAFIKILKIMEKFYITLKNSKVQNLRVAGQVAVEVDDNDSGIMPPLNIVLSPPNLWEDESKVNKRPSRKDLILNSRNSFYQLQLGKLKGNVPLFDYLINQKSVDPNKIPVFFMYKVESPAPSKCNFLIQYKINEKLNQTFYDVEITINFKASLSQFGMKTVPSANVVGEKSVTWKAKTLNSDSKGKLGVSLENCYDISGGLLEDIKVTLKGMSLINEAMNVYGSLKQNASPDQIADTNIFTACQKRQIIEYKVLANDA